MKIQPEKLLMIDDVEYIGSIIHLHYAIVCELSRKKGKSLHLKSLFPKISLSIKFFFEYLSSVFQFPPFSFPESCFLSSSGNLQFSQGSTHSSTPTQSSQLDNMDVEALVERAQ
ncbi:hypothetical protein ES332_D13G175300v1 [Gossypium tomentosum]|uniref:Uncharacterized protein n=1 Tax=Gossypium tomentosum TaxID=34277 RepID=A0A5D2HYI5_GOSTO|nr:hypothetical protein ES332_D13G175300v1 [Gossypium tomentosum]